jgi:dihydrofolate reductase
MRTLMYYVACSVDGFIAHKDGTFEGFLPEGEHVQDFLDSYEWFDVVLMGRKTYDVGLKEGVTNPYPTLESYVFSRSMKESPDPVVTLVSGNLVEVVRDLRSQDGKAIWLCGGADLAAQLFGAGLVDELVLEVNPFLMGEGIPLFAGVVQQSPLELFESKNYDNGVLLLKYRVQR